MLCYSLRSFLGRWLFEVAALLFLALFGNYLAVLEQIDKAKELGTQPVVSSLLLIDLVQVGVLVSKPLAHENWVVAGLSVVDHALHYLRTLFFLESPLFFVPDRVLYFQDQLVEVALDFWHFTWVVLDDLWRKILEHFFFRPPHDEWLDPVL